MKHEGLRLMRDGCTVYFCLPVEKAMSRSESIEWCIEQLEHPVHSIKGDEYCMILREKVVDQFLTTLRKVLSESVEGEV